MYVCIACICCFILFRLLHINWHDDVNQFSEERKRRKKRTLFYSIIKLMSFCYPDHVNSAVVVKEWQREKEREEVKNAIVETKKSINRIVEPINPKLERLHCVFIAGTFDWNWNTKSICNRELEVCKSNKLVLSDKCCFQKRNNLNYIALIV